MKPEQTESQHEREKRYLKEEVAREHNKYLLADAAYIEMKCQLLDLEQNRNIMRAEIAIKDQLIAQMELNIAELMRMSNLNHTLES